MKISAESAVDKLKQTGYSLSSSHMARFRLKFINRQRLIIKNRMTRTKFILCHPGPVFYCEAESFPFVQGDFLFVPAGVGHRFENFTNDFFTWVIFYGAVGGEK